VAGGGEVRLVAGILVEAQQAELHFSLGLEREHQKFESRGREGETGITHGLYS